MAAANVRDVAERAGVSVGTVSNVLNGSPRVSPDTARRVQEAIDALGFVRNDAARQLRAGRNRTIGFVVLDVSNPFYTDVARGAELALAEHRRPLVLGNTGDDVARELAYLDLFEEQRIGGLLISPVGPVNGRLERLRDRGSPVVLVERRATTASFSSVSVDDRRGGELAATHLLELGRSRVAFLGGPAGIIQSSDRYEGAVRASAMHEASPPLRIELEAMNAESGRSGALRLLELPADRRPDAVFAANDLIALGVLQALTFAGVRVPDDIALIGYDDIYFAANAAVPLSSVRQPAREIGRTAAELLIAEIDDPGGDERRQVVFAPELVVRASTAGHG
ncbi:LacI family DNA-binding transcriptional regulator [Herbiconiux liangxiaofengii]|uniref:LacI family DNA-binding transcriptional regulator n=1 Tax=Herbiconiux liangxiaofengii TaxID=3342795 RepID=UPI0035B93EB2